MPKVGSTMGHQVFLLTAGVYNYAAVRMLTSAEKRVGECSYEYKEERLRKYTQRTTAPVTFTLRSPPSSQRPP